MRLEKSHLNSRASLAGVVYIHSQSYGNHMLFKIKPILADQKYRDSLYHFHMADPDTSFTTYLQSAAQRKKEEFLETTMQLIRFEHLASSARELFRCMQMLRSTVAIASTAKTEALWACLNILFQQQSEIKTLNIDAEIIADQDTKLFVLLAKTYSYLNLAQYKEAKEFAHKSLKTNPSDKTAKVFYQISDFMLGSAISNKTALNKAFLHAVMYNLDSIAMTLFSLGAQLTTQDIYGYNALHYSVINGNRNLCSQLLPNITANSRTNDGYTPLHCAAAQNDVELIRLLCTHKANVNLNTTDNGITPIYTAVYFRRLEAFRQLVWLHAKFNSSLLYPAVYIGDNNLILQELISTHGLNVNYTDTNGDTPLYYATMVYYNQPAAAMLITNGAWVDIGAGSQLPITGFYEKEGMNVRMLHGLENYLTEWLYESDHYELLKLILNSHPDEIERLADRFSGYKEQPEEFDNEDSEDSEDSEESEELSENDRSDISEKVRSSACQRPEIPPFSLPWRFNENYIKLVNDFFDKNLHPAITAEHFCFDNADAQAFLRESRLTSAKYLAACTNNKKRAQTSILAPDSPLFSQKAQLSQRTEDAVEPTINWEFGFLI